MHNLTQKVGGSCAHKRWLKSAQKLHSYTEKFKNNIACARSVVLSTVKQLHILAHFHYQDMIFIPVTNLVVPTIHKTYYNNNYLYKYNSNNRGYTL